MNCDLKDGLPPSRAAALRRNTLRRPFLLGIAFAALALIGVPRAFGGDGAVDSDRHVIVLYDPRTASPRLIQLLQEQVTRSTNLLEWPTKKVTAGTSLDSLLDTYYDYYSRGPGANPKTVQWLKSEIKRANNLQTNIVPANTHLRLPPTPLRAKTEYDESVFARLYNPTTQQYTLTSADLKPLAISANKLVGTAKQLSKWRDGQVVGLDIELTEDLRSLLQGLPTNEFIVTSPTGFEQLRLFEGIHPPCPSVDRWLHDSPYYHELANYPPANRDDILARAAQTPLVIVDWDVDNGHGHRVAAVAQYVLDTLGYGYLNATNTHAIKLVELNPVKARDDLVRLLDAYQAKLNVAGDDGLSGLFDDARAWVRNVKADDITIKNQRIKSILVQAVFWRYFTTTCWLNFSFTVESPSLRGVGPKYMIGSKAFGVLASGNTGLPLSTLMEPQADASTSDNLVNIADGTLEGTVIGDTSDLKLHTSVMLTAPGCGYPNFTESGSSFASPYIAAVSWLKFLMGRETAATAKRSLFRSAVLPSPALKTIDSGGRFDLPMYFTSPDSSVIDINGTAYVLTSGTLLFKIEDSNVGTTTKEFTIGRAMRSHVLSVYRCGSTVCASYRAWPDSAAAPEHLDGPLRAVEFHSISRDHGRMDAVGPEAVVTNYPTIRF